MVRNYIQKSKFHTTKTSNKRNLKTSSKQEVDKMRIGTKL